MKVYIVEHYENGWHQSAPFAYATYELAEKKMKEEQEYYYTAEYAVRELEVRTT